VGIDLRRPANGNVAVNTTRPILDGCQSLGHAIDVEVLKG